MAVAPAKSRRVHFRLLRLLSVRPCLPPRSESVRQRTGPASISIGERDNAEGQSGLQFFCNRAKATRKKVRSGMESDDTLASALADSLARLAAGDLSARDRIIELCSDRLRVLAHRMLARFPNVRRWDDTDDVFQNAAMRLHRALGQMQFDSPRSIMALAATQLHRELIDLARRHAGPASYAANHGTNMIPLASGADAAGGRHIDGMATPETPLDRWNEFHEAARSFTSSGISAPTRKRSLFSSTARNEP